MPHLRILARFFALAVMLALVAVLVIGMLGCAAGRLEDTGEVVVGFRVASIPETAGQFIKQAAGFLPPPWNIIAGSAVGLLGLGGVGAAGHKLANKARDKADEHFDEGVARGAGVPPVPVAPLVPPPIAASVPPLVPAPAN